VGNAVDSVEDLRNAGYFNGKPSVSIMINRQPAQHHRHRRPHPRILPQLKAAIRRAST